MSIGCDSSTFGSRLAWLFSAAALFVACIFGVTAAARSNDETVIERFKRGYEDSSAANRAEAVSGILSPVDTPEAVDLLVAVLKDKDEGVRNTAVQVLAGYKQPASIERMHAALSAATESSVRASLTYALGRIANPGSLELIIEISGGKSADEKRAAAEALGSFRNDPTALRALAPLAGDADVAVRITAIRSLGRLKDGASAGTIAKAISDPVWQVRAAAIEAAGKLQRKELIGPLIEQLGKEEGRLLADIHGMLVKMTEYDFGGESKEWAEWWKRSAETFQFPAPGGAASGAAASPGASPPAPKNGAVPGSGEAAGQRYGVKETRYYGVNTPSKNMIFVLDVSKSMAETTNLPPGFVPKGKGAPATTASTGKALEPAKPTRVFTSNVKMEIAKEELIQTIQEMEEKINFDIITFETHADRWKGELVAATADNREDAIAFIRKQKPRGSEPVKVKARPGKPSKPKDNFDKGRTNLWGGLEMAFGIAGANPTGGAVTGPIKNKVDTIFLLSDGLPTDGKITSTDEILEEVRRINSVRQIVIHTFQMGKTVDSSFVRDLAEQNGGKWVNLTP